MYEVLPNKKGDAMLNDASIEFDVYANVAVNNVGTTFCNSASWDMVVVRYFRMCSMMEFQSSSDVHSVSAGYIHSRAKSGLGSR